LGRGARAAKYWLPRARGRRWLLGRSAQLAGPILFFFFYTEIGNTFWGIK
jgi:hypothetical protein